MIKVSKQQSPQILEKNKNKWTKERLFVINKGQKPPNRFKNHPVIKEILKEDCFGKCIYCESAVEPVHFGDVEHLLPKSKFPELTYDWDNLGFVCPRCNNEKRDKHDESVPFINPYKENPSSFIVALGAIVHHKPNNKRGKLSIREIGLNRPGLIEARDERIRRIEKMIGWYKAATNQTVKDDIYKEIKKEVSKEKEYCFCCSSILEALLT